MDPKVKARVYVVRLCSIKRLHKGDTMDLHHSGWEPSLVPVELCPLPVAKCYRKGRALKQEASPFRAE